MDINSIITKYLCEEATPQEEEALMEWVEASEDNKKEFLMAKAIWNAKSIYGTSAGMADFPAFMRGVYRKVKSEERRRRRRNSIYVIAGFAAAACIAAVIMFFTGVRQTPVIQDVEYLTHENTTVEVIPVHLPDGTSVWLKPGSSLIAPKEFPVDSREVELAGAAYFDVVRIEDAPFSVRTDDVTVRVLGTSFCVTTLTEGDKVEVVLETGSVRLQTPQGQNLATLSPDQRAIYDPYEEDLRITSVNAATQVLMEYNLISMAEATLYQIITKVEEDYKVRLSGPVDNLGRKYKFNYLRSNSIDQVLQIIEYLTGNRYTVVYKASENGSGKAN